MECSSWGNLGGRNFKSGLNHEKNCYERIVSLDVMVGRFKKSRWRLLWRKLMRKKKIFDCTSTIDHVPSYNPRTYLQNFDQGTMWADPDYHSRSFSARFAVPSRILQGSKLAG